MVRRGSMRALVVEDSPAGRRLLKTIVASAGLSVQACAHGLEALQLHKAKAFDAIVTDWIMPRMDGQELLRALRDAGDLTPVLLISGHRDESTRKACLALGRTAWLEKPIVLEELRAALEILLPRQQQPSLSREPAQSSGFFS